MSDVVCSKESFISVQFLACIPISCFSWSSTVEHDKIRKQVTCKQPFIKTSCDIHSTCQHQTWSENCQVKIFNETVFHAQALKYAPTRSYQKVFIKHLINKVETCGETCCEDVYTYYINLLADSKQDFSFKSYYLPSVNSFIALRESINLVSAGTTGLTTWKGGLFLTEWCLLNRKQLAGTRVIELGSGAGLTGLAVAKSIKVESFTFTDVHPDVLEQLNLNIGLNDLDRDKCHVECLDWTQTVTEFTADVILAADVVFDPTLIPDLVKTLSKLLRFNHNSVAYVASTVRNESTYQLFIDLLGQNDVNYEDLDTIDVENIFLYDRDCNIRLIKLSPAR